MIMNKQTVALKLQKYYFKYKKLPSYKEMTVMFGYSSKGAPHYVIKQLIEDGLLDKDENGKLVPKKLLSIPNLGIVKAGYPTPADVQNDALDIFEYLLGIDGTIFSLTVKGDSMVEEGIHNGDVVLVNKDLPAKDGNIVVANVDGEWTVKFLEHDDMGKVVLIPANDEYPKIYPKESLEIGGVVVSVIRKYH